mgnify:CR=1 FL=1
MAYISWLDFFILILAVFSVNYLILNEGAIIFSKKSYLTKWGLCFLVSILLIILHIYSPYSFIFLLALSVTGAVDIISNLIVLVKKKENHNFQVEIKELSDIVNLMVQNYQNQAHESIAENKSNTTSASKSKKTEPSKKGQEAILRTKSESKEPRVIKSNRLYGLEEFIKESEGQNVILSSNLRSNLQISKPTDKNKK